MLKEKKMKNKYGKEFYERGIEQNGVDYNAYGDWQINYAKMIIAITDILETASNNKDSLMLDVGCACGVTLKAFKETAVFGHYLGIDISEYMITLGKETHDFKDGELLSIDISEEPIPLEDNSVTLLHCSHTLEHLNEDAIPMVIEEFHRVLHPDGFGLVVVPTIKPGHSKAKIAEEETHLIIEPMNWWRSRFAKKFSVDGNIRKEFKKSPFGPSSDDTTTFYEHYNKGWTLYGLRKDK